MKDEMEWHSGPPPHVGWWNASAGRDPDVWRWWDGAQWSIPMYPDDLADLAGAAALIPEAPHFAALEWRHYYPEGARVPRINPEAA